MLHEAKTVHLHGQNNIVSHYRYTYTVFQILVLSATPYLAIMSDRAALTHLQQPMPHRVVAIDFNYGLRSEKRS
jgi:hypothetical protein